LRKGCRAALFCQGEWIQVETGSLVPSCFVAKRLSRWLLDVALFGVLVRDQAVRERDLLARGQSLGNQLQTPTVCCLLGLYLPWPISDLVDAIYAGGSA
jgi:hypothetical protein